MRIPTVLHSLCACLPQLRVVSSQSVFDRLFVALSYGMAVLDLTGRLTRG